MSPSIAALVVGALVVAGILGWALGRKFLAMGYRLGADTLVRCRDGHLFRTTWVPGVSFNAIRLGPVRFQFCPVGRHWTFVTLVPGGGPPVR